jgi:hypothetical protein
MSSFFEDLNDLVAENPAGRVLAVALAILFVSGAVALGFAYWITHRH